ncbi:Eisosome assembly protein [Elasticomyces elasticus]|nr:Eisosome assembly protein [Elasticomyces elasticus]KAK4911845.1 Eisosome assembly protein [Elasticomyces elasticus]KAK5768273.1 Eisosome assembly protein [Elasticomyces elasticus]
MACPDPSAHEQHSKLSEQASSAALYATDHARSTDPRQNALGPDGKLSSRSRICNVEGAAASLKYARPEDLPSYPSSGLANADSAGKAAMLAKDYKMKDLWHPEMSSAGSKAALLAHRDGGKVDLWHPTASKDGNSAANIAMRTKGLSPELDRGYTADGKQRALLAATLSVSRSGVAPAPAAPSAYPDSKNASFNALNAATKSHRANSVRTQADRAGPDGWNSDAMQAARIQNIGGNMAPEMFGEHPPVEIEQQEKRHNAALHASAVSMAKQMYDVQNRTVLGPDLRGGLQGADAATARQQPSSQKDLKQEAMRYIHLQDAAHKLAQERLAKVDKTFEDAKYREYYGYPDQQPTQRRSMNRLSMRSKGRRRGTGDSNQSDSDDDERAQKIRSQMSQLNSGVNNVDEKKRTDDRARLMAAAEKKVHAQMHSMDEKVFADTGKVPPAMMEEWEAKARARAQEEKKEQAQHPGQTHIGGGKYVATSEIEAIAAARLKPTLDEIDATAQKRRARDQELREEKDEQERTKKEEKVKQREEKEETKKLKNEVKAAKKQYNEEAKARKSEDNRKSRELKREPGTAATDDEAGTDGEEVTATNNKRSSTLGRITSRLRRNRKGTDAKEAEVADKPVTAGVVPVAEAPSAEGSKAVPATADNDAVSEISDYEPLPAPAGNQNVGLLAGRPNLEQHYSHIGDSSDEGEDEDDADDIQDAFAKADRSARADELAEKGKNHFGYGAAATGAGTDLGTHDSVHPPVLGPEHQTVTDDVDPCGPPGTDVAEEGGLHQTRTANLLDPKVSQDVAVPATSSTAVSPDSATPDVGKHGDETGLASATFGPHDSNITNIIDPRVKPEASKLKAREKQAEGKSALSDEPTEKEQKGLRGFLSKFKGGRGTKEPGKISSGMRHGSASDGKQSSEASVPAIGTTASATQPGQHDGASNDPTHISGAGGNPRAVSPSSFRRRSRELDELSDVSSSGLEEEDLYRGRGSKSRKQGGKSTLTQKLGMGGKGKGRETEDEDDEQFEEARDHFDETLAPPPAFGGQAKSASPVRETRFKEDV